MAVSHLSNCQNLSTPAPEAPHTQSSQLDYDVVVILAAMICALMCALGLNSMLQCVVRCTRRAVTEPAGWVAHRRLNMGLKREHVIALPVATYALTSTGMGSPVQHMSCCAICLSDFADGERIRVLPVCGHRFHVICIDKWLVSHCSCPTCRRRLLATEGIA